MAATGLASNTHEVADAFAANELFQSNGWTDGLPIVPPTPAGVRAFLDTGARSALSLPVSVRVGVLRRRPPWVNLSPLFMQAGAS